MSENKDEMRTHCVEETHYFKCVKLEEAVNKLLEDQERKKSMTTQKELKEAFSLLLKAMYDIMEQKNADYSGSGEAFTNFNQIEQITKGKISREMGVVVRMTDKLSRVIRLLENSGQVLDEKIEDTLIDLANYSLLLILMLKEKS